MKKKAKWTFMVYLAGDNNLSSAGEKDLGEMRSIGSTEDVNIVAEFDRIGASHETQRYHIQKDGVSEETISIGETDCGDPKVLLDFIQWTADNYPAEKYCLILWNHGGGWAPTEIDRIAKSVNARNYSSREVTERSASPLKRVLFRTSFEEIFKLQTPTERAICSDDGSGHSLDTIELGNVLKQGTKILGGRLDLLGMDACLMSNLEVAYQVQPYVKYIVASEENEPNDGWPYDRVLQQLVDDPEITTPEFARYIVSTYVQSYIDKGYTGSVTQAALHLDNIQLLTEPLDQLANSLIPNMDTGKHEFSDAILATEANFYGKTLWDIAEFSENIGLTFNDQEISSATEDIQDILQPISNQFVLAESHSGTKVEKCGGVTIYIPPRILHSISQYYNELEFAKKHQWLKLLEAYHSKQSIPTPVP